MKNALFHTVRDKARIALFLLFTIITGFMLTISACDNRPVLDVNVKSMKKAYKERNVAYLEAICNYKNDPLLTKKKNNIKYIPYGQSRLLISGYDLYPACKYLKLLKGSEEAVKLGRNVATWARKGQCGTVAAAWNRYRRNRRKQKLISSNIDTFANAFYKCKNFNMLFYNVALWDAQAVMRLEKKHNLKSHIRKYILRKGKSLKARQIQLFAAIYENHKWLSASDARMFFRLLGANSSGDMYVIEYLGRAKYRPAAARIAKNLNHPSHWVRKAAAWAVGELKYRPAKRKLNQMIRNRFERRSVKQAARGALVKM